MRYLTLNHSHVMRSARLPTQRPVLPLPTFISCSVASASRSNGKSFPWPMRRGRATLTASLMCQSKSASGTCAGAWCIPLERMVHCWYCGGHFSFLPGQAEDGCTGDVLGCPRSRGLASGDRNKGPHQALLQLASMQRKRGIGVGLPDELEYLHLHEVSTSVERLITRLNSRPQVQQRN